MYSSIANDSFSYLLTLDDMRKNLPEETRPSWVKVTTITMISSFKREIDIKKLRSIFEEIGSYKLRRDGSNTEGFEWKLKPTTFYNQVTLSYHDNYSTKSVKVFPNGSIQVAGCCDLFDCKRVITQLVYIFKKFLNMDIDSISTDTFRVVMINSNFSLNYNINLMKVADWFEEYDDIFKVSFEPDRYSAVKIKFKPSEDMKEITTSIFSTGKIIITGAETLKEIAFAYNIINNHINENPQIRVSRTEETDVFDIYLGYRCDPFVKLLKEKGFNSWMRTITNRQIKF